MLKDSPHLSLKSICSLENGKILPVVEYQLSAAHVFMFSAITWNRHLIHYSKDRALAEGHSDIVIQRGLLGNLFTRYVNELFVDNFITYIDWKVKASVYPDQIICCQGEILEFQECESGDLLKLRLQLTHENKVISEAQLTMRTIRKLDNTRLHNWDNTQR